jgi:hypothetical protein
MSQQIGEVPVLFADTEIYYHNLEYGLDLVKEKSVDAFDLFFIDTIENHEDTILKKVHQALIYYHGLIPRDSHKFTEWIYDQSCCRASPLLISS